MLSRVIISKSLLSAFRKRALAAYPNETMQTLWGRLSGNSVIVTSMRTPEQKVSETEVVFYEDDLSSPAVDTREQYLGTIHSHPECLDATPSQVDWDTSFEAGEYVFGIMRIVKKVNGRFTTEVAWWEPRPMIATVFPRVRNANRNNKPKTESETVQIL